MIGRQSNNQWIAGIAAHPATKKKSECLDIFGIKRVSSSLSYKGPNYQRGVLLISAGAN